MTRPNPIQYAERLYAAIRAANFSPISFLTFGNAIKDGVELRRMPRIAAEPFMRVVGEMLELEEEASPGWVDADLIIPTTNQPSASDARAVGPTPSPAEQAVATEKPSSGPPPTAVDGELT